MLPVFRCLRISRLPPGRSTGKMPVPHIGGSIPLFTQAIPSTAGVEKPSRIDTGEAFRVQVADLFLDSPGPPSVRVHGALALWRRDVSCWVVFSQCFVGAMGESTVYSV